MIVKSTSPSWRLRFLFQSYPVSSQERKKHLLVLRRDGKGEIISMTTVITGSFRPTIFPIQLNRNLVNCLFRSFTAPVFRRSLTPKVRAFATAFGETKPMDTLVVEKEDSVGDNVLACPICYDPLARISDSPLYVGSTAGSKLLCNTCKKTYFGNETHLDLVASSGSKPYDESGSKPSDESMPLATELFRTSVVSFLYERGWRQGFVILGFPGPEKEFDMAKNYLRPMLGGNIVDASCGSGLFSRLFAKSGLFSRVFALDYSENMLRQCYKFIEEEENFPKEKVTLVKADISRLPFKSSSIDAVHAGAAVHCWPSSSTAVAEISRVLRPGGVFVATTFIFDGPYAYVPFLSTFSQYIMGMAGGFIVLSERELEDLCRTCGLVGFTCIRNRRFVIFSARKRS